MNPPGGVPDHAVVRSHWDDALERDGEMLVLCGQQVSLLSAVAAEAARIARGGITVGELEAHLIVVFGLPIDEEPRGRVRAILIELAERGVVTVEIA